MGTPLPPNEPTSGCALCFGPDKSLGSVQPKYLDVKFTGVREGDAFDDGQDKLPNGVWRLTHISGCLYEYRSQDFFVRCNFGATRTNVGFQMFGGELDTWLGFVGAPCQLKGLLGSTSPVGKKAYLGTADISWPLEGL